MYHRQAVFIIQDADLQWFSGSRWSDIDGEFRVICPYHKLVVL